jgi:hypothetical protein
MLTREFALADPANRMALTLASTFHIDSDETLKSHRGLPLSCKDATVLSIQGITKWCRL